MEELKVKMMKEFLVSRTVYNPEKCKFNKGVKSDCCVNTENGKVNFWFDDEQQTLYYGIVGFGVCASASYSSLIKN